jgi:hypothetical protein
VVGSGLCVCVCNGTYLGPLLLDNLLRSPVLNGVRLALVPQRIDSIRFCQFAGLPEHVHVVLAGNRRKGRVAGPHVEALAGLGVVPLDCLPRLPLEREVKLVPHMP